MLLTLWHAAMQSSSVAFLPKLPLLSSWPTNQRSNSWSASFKQRPLAGRGGAFWAAAAAGTWAGAWAGSSLDGFHSSSDGVHSCSADAIACASETASSAAAKGVIGGVGGAGGREGASSAQERG